MGGLKRTGLDWVGRCFSGNRVLVNLFKKQWFTYYMGQGDRVITYTLINKYILYIYTVTGIGGAVKEENNRADPVHFRPFFDFFRSKLLIPLEKIRGHSLKTPLSTPVLPCPGGVRRG